MSSGKIRPKQVCGSAFSDTDRGHTHATPMLLMLLPLAPMLAVLLLVCIAILSACIRVFIDALIDLTRPVAQRLHGQNYPRFFIWGIVGSLFCSVALYYGFPKETAIALIIASACVGLTTSVVSHLRIFKDLQL
jgi:hypothetical protein